MEKELFFEKSREADNAPETLNSEIEGFLENRAMYNLPGFPDITEENIRRYIESNKELYKKLPDIIQESFKREDWEDYVNVVTTIPYVLESQQKPLQKQCLKLCQRYFNKKRDRSVREGAISMIPYIPIKKRTVFIQKSLKDKDAFIRRKGAEMISYTLETEQGVLREQCLKTFQKNFKDRDPLIRKDAVAMISYVPVEKRARLIQRVYEEEKYISVIIQAIRTIPSAPVGKRAGLIQMFFKAKDPFVRQEAIQIIPSASEEKVKDLFQKALLDENPDNRKFAKRMMQRILGEEKRETDVQTKKREEEQKNNPLIQELAGRSSLYEGDKKFFREDFPKDHSEITLLDKIPGQPEKSLRQRIIIRHIQLTSYLLWKKVYEAHKYWREKGFDYVPVEPIVRVSHHESIFNKVDVFTRVLNGPSVETWIKNNGPYQLEIEEQMRKIERSLEEMEIDHGHLHQGNFVLLFPRNEDGTPNLSHPPQIYIIDFDIAKPKQKSEE